MTRVTPATAQDTSRTSPDSIAARLARAEEMFETTCKTGPVVNEHLNVVVEFVF